MLNKKIELHRAIMFLRALHRNPTSRTPKLPFRSQSTSFDVKDNEGKEPSNSRNSLTRRAAFIANESAGALSVLPKDADGCIELTLSHKSSITHDSYLFRFLLPRSDMELGLPIGKHVVFHANIPTYS